MPYLRRVLIDEIVVSPSSAVPSFTPFPTSWMSLIFCAAVLWLQFFSCCIFCCTRWVFGLGLHRRQSRPGHVSIHSIFCRRTLTLSSKQIVYSFFSHCCPWWHHCSPWILPATRSASSQRSIRPWGSSCCHWLSLTPRSPRSSPARSAS